MITIDLLRWLKRRRAAPVAAHHHDAPVGIARDIALTGRWEMLDDLPALDRTAVTVRLVVQGDHPLPLFRWLWRQAGVDPNYLLTLARCLRVVNDSAPLWTIRVGTALAEDRAGGMTTGLVLQALLDCLPALDAALDRIVQRKRLPMRLLRRLFRALPTDWQCRACLVWRSTRQPRQNWHGPPQIGWWNGWRQQICSTTLP